MKKDLEEELRNILDDKRTNSIIELFDREFSLLEQREKLRRNYPHLTFPEREVILEYGFK